MSASLRWGILSTARINRRIIPRIREATRSEVVAVASRDGQKATAYAQEWEIPISFGSYENLVAAPEVDVIYISLPNSMHVEWAIKAANNGKHVLCEKPIALLAAEVDKIETAATTNNVVIAEALMYQMHPQIGKLKSIIAEGLIRGSQINPDSSFTFTLPEGADNFRLNKNMGAGSLWDIGSYPVSLANSLVGETPVQVFGFQQTNEDGIETTMVGQLKYRNGVMAQIDSSFRMPYRIGAEVIGENGVIRLAQPWQPNVERRSGGLLHIAPDDTETYIETEAIDPYLCQIQAMERAIVDGDPVPHSLDHSRANIATINALHQSADQGQIVAVTR